MNDIKKIQQLTNSCTRENFEPALSKYREAKTIYNNSLPSLHLNQALPKTNLGNVHFATGNCQKALDEYELALKNQEAWLPVEHRYIAQMLHNLAIVHPYQVNMDEANKYLERAQEINNQRVALQHPV